MKAAASGAGKRKAFPDARSLGAIEGPMDGGFRHVSNRQIPAGYTYFAQFLAHDLTFGQQPSLALGSLYGRGPLLSPHLYDPRRPGFLVEGAPLRAGGIPDVPRDRSGRALIGESRNDRTLIIAQLHAVFIRAHNHLLELLEGRDRESSFEIAKRLLRERYRRLVVDDLLPRLVPPEALALSLDEASSMSRVPDEFTLAAGQLGHSMVQPRYRINDQAAAVVDYPAFHPRIFTEEGDEEPLKDLRGQALRPLAAVEWRNFFPLDRLLPVQPSSKIDAKICRPLFRFPIPGATDSRERSLPYRTLVAGQRAGLPSGQELARTRGFEPLAGETIWEGLPYDAGTPAPLWFYLLREAAVEQRGERFGQLGGTIFAAAVRAGLQADGASPADLREVPDDGLGEEVEVGDWIHHVEQATSARE
jgi:hypothetical protein